MLTATGLLNRINAVILNPLIVLLFTVAMVVFVYGIVKFISGSGVDDAREQGKRAMFWGIVGMFIMVSVFGIIRLILNTFGISTSGSTFYIF